MIYEKIDDNTFKTVLEKIINKQELIKSIDELKVSISSLESLKIKIDDKLNANLKQASIEWNTKQDDLLVSFKNDLAQKEKLLNELSDL